MFCFTTHLLHPLVEIGYSKKTLDFHNVKNLNYIYIYSLSFITYYRSCDLNDKNEPSIVT